MKDFLHKIFTKYHIWIALGLICLVAVIIGYGEYRRVGLERQITGLSKDLALATSSFNIQFKGLQDQIASIVTQNNLLNNTIQTQITNNTAQVGQVNDTAAALDKLSKVDPQLLQKYSKVYFLNENYVPASLISIPFQYTYDRNISYKILDGVAPHLEKMFDDAGSDHIILLVISAYRSFGTQAALKSSYQVTYGAGTANQFSADQGYSEHQLGTTVDITTADVKDNTDLFDGTAAYTWLTNNAYKYGFILSYPKNNAYYVYEPWHWRFVGVDLANKLHREVKNFYDLDQRVINDYLGVFFD